MPEQKRTYQYVGLKNVYPYKLNKSTQHNESESQDIFNFWPKVLYIVFGIYLALLLFALWSSKCEVVEDHHRKSHM